MTSWISHESAFLHATLHLLDYQELQKPMTGRESNSRPRHQQLPE
jgi:hypothetical protein